MRLGRIAAIALNALVITSSPSYSRNVFEDAWAVVTDPLKLGQSSKTLSDSLERTLIQLQQLEGQANYDVQQRLEQIRSILKDAISGSQATIDLATARMLTLEGQINSDAVNLIYQVQCTTNTILNDQLQQAFAKFISTLKKADPAVTIFGYHVVDFTTNEVKIDNPNDAYVSAKAAALTALNKEISDQSSAYRIVFIYQNLQNAARYARCAYPGQRSAEVLFTKEVNDWERLALPWVTIVTPKL